jgi:hypothetical protein
MTWNEVREDVSHISENLGLAEEGGDAGGRRDLMGTGEDIADSEKGRGSAGRPARAELAREERGEVSGKGHRGRVWKKCHLRAGYHLSGEGRVTASTSECPKISHQNYVNSPNSIN